MKIADPLTEFGLPCSVDGEKVILGSILNDNDYFSELADKLDYDDFFLDSHQRIFAAMKRLMNKGTTVDLVTLAEELAFTKEVEAVGGVAYVASLTEHLPRRLVIKEYIKIVKDKSLLRQLIAVCEEGIERAAEESEEAVQLIPDIDKKIVSVVAGSFHDWPDIAQQTADELSVFDSEFSGQQVRRYLYGIHLLDRTTGGLVLGRTTLFAARPGMGKSWFVLQTVKKLCEEGVPCHLFTFEMAAGETLRRLWALVSGVPYNKIENPDCLRTDEKSIVARAAYKVAEWPLQIDDVATMGVDQVAARMRISKRRYGTTTFFMDYFQRMKFSRSKDRFQEISDAGKLLATVAKEEKVVNFWVSSLTIKNGQKMPTMDDVRGSGDLPYEAHVVVLLHRDTEDDSGQVSDNGVLIVEKARAGFSGKIPVTFENCMFK